MSIQGQQNINIGLPNQPANSDSLYTAFTKIQENFDTLFACAISYNTFAAGTGISVNANANLNTVTVTNTGVTNLIAGLNIAINQSNGNVTISATGTENGGGTLSSVGVEPVSNSRLVVTNSPLVVNGNIGIDLATSGVTSGVYINPTITVDNYGRITTAISNDIGANVAELEATARKVTLAPDIVDALTAAAAGQKIILDRAYTLSSAISLTLTADMHIEVLPSASITYTGASHLTNFILFNMAGYNLQITGAPRSFLIDANNKANSCFEVRQTSPGATPICRLEALDCRNARMVAATTSAVGMAFFGRAQVSFVGVQAKNITRAAGTGSSGSRGSFGIVAAESGSLYPVSVELNDWIADTIQTDDAAGNAARVDCDGCVLKVAGDTGDRIYVDLGHGIEIMGRDIKLQGFGADAIVETHQTTRSVRPITGGTSIVDFQTESGFLGELSVWLSGSDVNLEPLNGVDISPRTAGDPYPRYLGDVNIVDNSSGADGMWAAYAATPAVAAVGSGKKFVTRTGTATQRGKPLRHLITIGNSGAMNHSVYANGFSGEISNAVISVGGTNPTGLKAYYTGVRNIGSTIVACKRADAASLGINWGHHYDLGGNFGIFVHDGVYNPGALGSSNGPSILDASRGRYYPGDSRATVERVLCAESFAAGATVDLGRFGYSGFDGTLEVRITGSNGYVSTWAVTGTTFNLIYRQTSAFIQSGSVAAPVGTPSTIELWKNSATGNLMVTNNYPSTAFQLFVRTW